MSRLPDPGQDSGVWGVILNDYLSVAHSATGTIKDGAVTKANVGLSNVDNTADSAKPVSTLQQTALNLKANVADVYTKTASDARFIQTVNGTIPDAGGNVTVAGEPGPVGPYAPYSMPVYILESNQTISNVPSDFPNGGLVFQKTA